jgi:hypothetical protein
MGKALKLTIAIAVAATLATSGCSGVQPELVILDRPAGVTDALPTQLEIPEELHAIRYVGDARGGAAVYAARGSEDRPWCLLLLAPQPPGKVTTWPVTSECRGDGYFALRGVRASVDGVDGKRVSARLLPDQFTGDIPQGWEMVGPNLALPQAS